MQVTWLEALGLIGVTLVVTRGKIFDSTRAWLKGFVHPANPLRLGGELISCPMCSGVWVGFVWGILQGWDVWFCLLFGGFVSLTSFVADSLTGLLELACENAEKKAPHQVTLAELARARQALREQRHVVRGAPKPTSQEISEDDADAFADEEQRIADEAVVPKDVLRQYEKAGI